MICPWIAALLRVAEADSWAVVFLELELAFDFPVVLLVIEISEVASELDEPNPTQAGAPPAIYSVSHQTLILHSAQQRFSFLNVNNM